MNNLFYAFKQVFRPRWINLIKIASLALGICISAALMCMVAWQRNFDNFWLEKENLLYLEMDYKFQNDPDENGSDMKCPPALAPFIAYKIASVEAGTRFRYPEHIDYLVGKEQFSLSTYYVDTSFFDVLKIEMIMGENPKDILKKPGNIIISEKTAAILFSNEDPLGQQIRNDGEIYTICGICKDLPKNSFFENAQIITGTDIPLYFDGNTAWFTLFRVYPNTNINDLNTEINTLLEPVINAWGDAGIELSFRVKHLCDYSKKTKTGEHAILSVLAFALLLIAGLSFALLSISSLTSRAKEVGVRKAAGARISGIFSLIIAETVIFVLTAALLSAIIFWGFKIQLENITGNYEDIFALENLWAAGLVLIVLIIIAGIIPAWIFSRIPVTQVFQRFTSNHSYWKRILLFIQFSSSIFVICFMLITLRQYQTSLLIKYGYAQDKLIWMRIDNVTKTQQQALMAEISSDSRVEAVTTSDNAIWWGVCGLGVRQEGNMNEPVPVKRLSVDTSFFRTYGIPILYGSNNLTANFDSNGGEVVVNQAFLEKLNITENPLGKTCFCEGITVTIGGVCRNFASVSGDIQPFMISNNEEELSGVLTVRVNEVTKEVVKAIEEKVKLFYQNEPVPEIYICSHSILQAFNDIRMLRDEVMIASICLLLITIMGILGYVNLEIRRRTREIAIRKIHGSTALKIIWKISRGLLFIALLSAVIAIPLAYIVGSYWQQDFPTKANLNWRLFAGATFVIVITIAICTILQTWRTANANPARAIKAE